LTSKSFGYTSGYSAVLGIKKPTKNELYRCIVDNYDRALLSALLRTTCRPGVFFKNPWVPQPVSQKTKADRINPIGFVIRRAGLSALLRTTCRPGVFYENPWVPQPVSQKTKADRINPIGFVIRRAGRF